jgi:ZIP family zinc transporter
LPFVVKLEGFREADLAFFPHPVPGSVTHLTLVVCVTSTKFVFNLSWRSFVWSVLPVNVLVRHKEIDMNWSVAALMVGAEMFGALVYCTVKSNIAKKLLSCVGLGFAVAIVFGDILPDATQHYSNIQFWMPLTMIGGFLLTIGLTKLPKISGSYAGVLGFSVHNICEGFILTIVQTMTPLKFIGFVLHKLPEGAASCSFLEGLKPRTKLAITLASALMIPVGAFLPFSDQSPFARPFTTFAAGVILGAVSLSLRTVFTEPSTENRNVRLGMSLASGVAIGVLSCILFG